MRVPEIYDYYLSKRLQILDFLFMHARRGDTIDVNA